MSTTRRSTCSTSCAGRCALLASLVHNLRLRLGSLVSSASACSSNVTLCVESYALMTGVLAVQLHDGVPLVLAPGQAFRKHHLDRLAGEPVPLPGMRGSVGSQGNEVPLGDLELTVLASCGCAASSMLRERRARDHGGVLDDVSVPQVSCAVCLVALGRSGFYDAHTCACTGCCRDGLLFYLKAAHYELGLSPLALVWKDANTSRYFVYTEKPSIVLRLDEAHNFTTLEGVTLFSAEPGFLQQHEVRIHAVCLGVLTSAFAQRLLCVFVTPGSLTRSDSLCDILVRMQLSEGDLAKFSFEHGFIDSEQRPHLAGLAFDKRCSPQRALADSWTKILFQYNARSGGVQIQHILEVGSIAWFGSC